MIISVTKLYSKENKVKRNKLVSYISLFFSCFFYICQLILCFQQDYAFKSVLLMSCALIYATFATLNNPANYINKK